MKIRTITDPHHWDQALLALPNPHVLQSWTWGSFKARHGWSADPLLFEQAGSPVAAALVLQRKLPHLPIAILYVPKGPILDWTDPDLASSVLDELQALARHRRALFIKIDPDVYYDQAAPVFSPRSHCGQETTRILRARNWLLSNDQIQFRNTVLLDLHDDEEALLAAMKQKTRYNVRLAKRRGVVIHHGTERDLDTFYQLYAETSSRDGFLIRQASYYHDAWTSMISAGRAHLLLASVEGEPVAALMLFTFGSTAWYMYGASSQRHRRAMPNNLLQWEAVRLAKELGCTLYDLWGAPDNLDESDPMWGVVRFKLGLGGQIAQGIGAWDYPASRAGYWLYTTAMPRVLAWMRQSHQDSSDLP